MVQLRNYAPPLGQLSLASLWGRLLDTSFGWGKGGNVTSVGWLVRLCDPMWHVSSVAVWQPCELLYTCYLLTYSHVSIPVQHNEFLVYKSSFLL